MRVKQLEALVVVWDQVLPSDQTGGALWRAGDGGVTEAGKKKGIKNHPGVIYRTAERSQTML